MSIGQSQNSKADNLVRSHFRSDINGLRAWAVIIVVLYHFGIPGFQGGFIGVDVFFVISGFLMTGIVIEGLEKSKFSLANFYIARARRILPALLALCAILLAVGWWLLTPPDYKQLSSHAVYALTFLSNIEFWQSAGYFDTASHEKFLLHTWSLSVEWQFYLMLPLILMFVWYLKPGRLAQILTFGVGIAVSFAASVWITATDSNAAFFLLHTRAWEMLAGGMLYLLSPAITLSANQKRKLEFAGLLLIVLAVLMFNSGTSWPGWRAALPVVGSMMVLAANRSSFWTGNPALQWVGERSYSLYLWHWPLYVGMVYAEVHNNAFAIVLALLATLFFGNASYVGVENTSRRWLSGLRLSVVVSCLAISVIAVVLPSALIWSVDGVGGRFTPAVELAASESYNGNPRRKECHPSKGLDIKSCVYGGLDWRVIALGDSHTSALISAIAAAEGNGRGGVVQWSYSGCSFVPGMKNKTQADKVDYQCEGFNAWAQGQLARLQPSIPVVLINRYAANALGTNEDGKTKNRPMVYFSRKFDTATPEFIAEFSTHIIDSACQLAKKRMVYMMRPIPEMGFDVPKTLSRRMAMGRYADLSITFEEYQARNAWVWAAQDAAHDQCGVKILDPTQYLCHAGICAGSLNGRPLYTDDDHLSEFGNKLLVPMFAEIYLAQ